MDFVFGLPLADGKNGVMTVVDRATKRVTLVAVHDTITAVQAADVFFEHVIRHYGVPREVVSDRDPRFLSTFW